MSTPASLRVSRWLARRLARNDMPLTAPAGVVSFTFDDAPASACTTGANMLERYGARGTFYVAGGLTDQLEEGKPCHSLAQLRRLLAVGHEIACHGYSHIRYDTLDKAELTAELDRNALFLADLGVDEAWLNFAYPFGAFSLGAKRLCGARFRSSRITGGGVHIGTADLNALQTFRLYAEPVGTDTFEDQLQRTADNKGWLILNTHDIDKTPGPYGYAPDRLEAAVNAALIAGCRILPMDAAIDYFERHKPL